MANFPFLDHIAACSVLSIMFYRYIKTKQEANKKIKAREVKRMGKKEISMTCRDQSFDV